MKIITSIFCLILLVSCGQEAAKNKQAIAENSTKDTFLPKINFNNVNEKGVLIGKNIKLLNDNLMIIKDITNFNEQIVEVKQISQNYYKNNLSDDDCQSFKYVKIKINDLEGYVDGRTIYSLIQNEQYKKAQINNFEVSIQPTNYIGIGVSNEEGLTSCTINTPIIFKDKANNYEGLVQMLKNDFYKEEYPYFELKNNDEAFDEIIDIQKKDNVFFLKIKRLYQEGSAIILVSIYQNKSNRFVAEILEKTLSEE